MRTICWFSAGAASAVATKLALAQWPEAIIARIVIPSESDDNDRFTADCEKWFDRDVVRLRSDRYQDTWDVWEKKHYIAGIAGAPCTTELKKMVRNAYELPGDIQVFGYTADKRDVKRAREFRQVHFEIGLETPLIDQGLTKAACKTMLGLAGIRLPLMYEQGYENNNCIGCPKGGAGYWNKIRVDYPAVFNRMSELETRLGARLIKLTSGRCTLAELDPAVGNYGTEDMSCGPLCSVQKML